MHSLDRISAITREETKGELWKERTLWAKGTKRRWSLAIFRHRGAWRTTKEDRMANIVRGQMSKRYCSSPLISGFASGQRVCIPKIRTLAPAAKASKDYSGK